MSYVQRVIDDVAKKHANEPEFVQTVTEVLTSLEPVNEHGSLYLHVPYPCHLSK